MDDKEVKKPGDAKPKSKEPDELSEADLEKTSGGGCYPSSKAVCDPPGATHKLD
jgi:hypothetical protein